MGAPLQDLGEVEVGLTSPILYPLVPCIDHRHMEGVGEYRRKLIELLAPLDGIPEEFAKGKFINGLIENIRAEVDC